MLVFLQGTVSPKIDELLIKSGYKVILNYNVHFTLILHSPHVTDTQPNFVADARMLSVTPTRRQSSRSIKGGKNSEQINLTYDTKLSLPIMNTE